MARVYRGSRVSQFACITARGLARRKRGVVSKLARVRARAKKSSRFLASGRRFRSKDPPYQSSRKGALAMGCGGNTIGRRRRRHQSWPDDASEPVTFQLPKLTCSCSPQHPKVGTWESGSWSKLRQGLHPPQASEGAFVAPSKRRPRRGFPKYGRPRRSLKKKT